MPQSVHELDVVLEGSSPAILRRLEVPSSMTLVQLHEALQVTMGWENAHRFAFYGEGANRLPPASSLLVVAPKTDSMLTYVYDFNDRWTHRICTRSLFELPKAPTTPAMHRGVPSLPARKLRRHRSLSETRQVSCVQAPREGRSPVRVCALPLRQGPSEPATCRAFHSRGRRRPPPLTPTLPTHLRGPS